MEQHRQFERASLIKSAERNTLRLSMRDGLFRHKPVYDAAAVQELEARLLLAEDAADETRIRNAFEGQLIFEQDEARWLESLERHRVEDLRQIADFRRCCIEDFELKRGPMPGIVIPFQTTVAPLMNLFGNPRAGSEPIAPQNAFANRIMGAQVVLKGYDTDQLGPPQIFLVPVGLDVTRDAQDGSKRIYWDVFDDKLPPVTDTLSVRRGLDFATARPNVNISIPAKTDSTELIEFKDWSRRLVGRSLENTRWLLVIPGENIPVGGDANRGLDILLGANGAPLQDIEVWFDIYSYGNGE